MNTTNSSKLKTASHVAIRRRDGPNECETEPRSEKKGVDHPPGIEADLDRSLHEEGRLALVDRSSDGEDQQFRKTVSIGCEPFL